MAVLRSKPRPMIFEGKIQVADKIIPYHRNSGSGVTHVATATLAPGWYEVVTEATIDSVVHAAGQMVYSDGTASLTAGSVKNHQTACLFVYGYSNNGYAILVGKEQLTYDQVIGSEVMIPAGWYKVRSGVSINGVQYAAGSAVYFSSAAIIDNLASGSGSVTRYTPFPLRSNTSIGANRTGTIMQCSFAPSQTIYYEVHDIEKLKDLYNLLLLVKMPTDVYDGV